VCTIPTTKSPISTALLLFRGTEDQWPQRARSSAGTAARRDTTRTSAPSSKFWTSAFKTSSSTTNGSWTGRQYSSHQQTPQKLAKDSWAMIKTKREMTRVCNILSPYHVYINTCASYASTLYPQILHHLTTQARGLVGHSCENILHGFLCVFDLAFVILKGIYGFKFPNRFMEISSRDLTSSIFFSSSANLKT
jgi:hypothetical protein